MYIQDSPVLHCLDFVEQSHFTKQSYAVWSKHSLESPCLTFFINENLWIKACTILLPWSMSPTNLHSEIFRNENNTKNRSSPNFILSFDRISAAKYGRDYVSNLDAQDLRKTSLFAVLFEFDAVRKVGCNCQTSGEEIYLHLCLAVNINLEYF